MNRHALLCRELQQAREHAAESAAFARRNVPQRVRDQLDYIASLDHRPTWERGDDSLPPVKFWLAWIGMLAFSGGCTYGAIKFVAWLPKLWEWIA